MDLTLYDTDRTLIDIFCIVFLCVSIYKSFSSVYGKAFRETISLTATIPTLTSGMLFIIFILLFYIRQISTGNIIEHFYMGRYFQSISAALHFPEGSSVDGDILTFQAIERTLDLRIFMSDQPFILGCHQTVLAVFWQSGNQSLCWFLLEEQLH